MVVTNDKIYIKPKSILQWYAKFFLYFYDPFCFDMHSRTAAFKLIHKVGNMETLMPFAKSMNRRYIYVYHTIPSFNKYMRTYYVPEIIQGARITMENRIWNLLSNY